MELSGRRADMADYFDQAAADFAERYGQKEFLKRRLRIFCAEIIDRAVFGGLYVDAGCGPAYMAGVAHACNMSVVGMDSSAEMLAIAQKQHPFARFIQAYLSKPIALESSAA